MTQTLFRRALALTLSLVLSAGVAVATAPAAQAAPSNDATLSSLTVSTGSFDAPFDPAGDTSNVTVADSATWFSFTPTSNDSTATIQTWNGDVNATTPSGTATANSWLREGNNTMTATVTAPDGTVKAYTIFVLKPSAPAPTYDLALSGLTVSDGTLSPAFDSGVLAYSVDVPYATTNITFAPGAVAAGNTVSVWNPSSGVTNPTVTLLLGGTSVLVTVTAPDNTSQVYAIQVTRGPAPTANVDLSDIELSTGTLSPAFDPAQQFYTATVPYAVRSMQITATASMSGHTMVINNAPITDGSPATVPLGFDAAGNGFAIRITAANGVEKIYIVKITRDQPSNNADLTSLSLSGSTLSPAFSNATTAYTTTVPYLTTSTVVTADVADATAILRVNGHDTISGAASAPVALKVGANSITVTATAEDGVTTTARTIVVTREAPDLDLSALTVSGGTLSPAFDAGTTSYTLALSYPVSSVDVAASAVEADWTLEIQGTEAIDATVAVPVGPSTIRVRVTALHGESREYTIAVTREAPSTNANLSAITLSDGTLSPAFSAGTTAYTATVGYLTEQVSVGATVADSTAGVTINGQTAASAVVPLVVGDNTITVVAIAEDGTTTIITTIVVTRQAALIPDVDIDLGFKAGDAAANAPFEVKGTNLRPGSTATVTMRSTPIVLATGNVRPDGTIVLSGRLPVDVEAGAHRLIFEGIAMDGSAVTSTGWFTVLRSGTIGAVSVVGPVDYVDPVIPVVPVPAPAVPAVSRPVTSAGSGAAALASTGADGDIAAAVGVSIATLGALLLLLGGVLRRRRTIA